MDNDRRFFVARKVVTSTTIEEYGALPVEFNPRIPPPAIPDNRQLQAIRWQERTAQPLDMTNRGDEVVLHPTQQNHQVYEQPQAAHGIGEVLCQNVNIPLDMTNRGDKVVLHPTQQNHQVYEQPRAAHGIGQVLYQNVNIPVDMTNQGDKVVLDLTQQNQQVYDQPRAAHGNGQVLLGNFNIHQMRQQAPALHPVRDGTVQPPPKASGIQHVHKQEQPPPARNNRNANATFGNFTIPPPAMQRMQKHESGPDNFAFEVPPKSGGLQQVYEQEQPPARNKYIANATFGNFTTPPPAMQRDHVSGPDNVAFEVPPKTGGLQQVHEQEQPPPARNNRNANATFGNFTIPPPAMQRMQKHESGPDNFAFEVPPKTGGLQQVYEQEQPPARNNYIANATFGNFTTPPPAMQRDHVSGPDNVAFEVPPKTGGLQQVHEQEQPPARNNYIANSTFGNFTIPPPAMQRGQECESGPANVSHGLPDGAAAASTNQQAAAGTDHQEPSTSTGNRPARNLPYLLRSRHALVGLGEDDEDSDVSSDMEPPTTAKKLCKAPPNNEPKTVRSLKLKKKQAEVVEIAAEQSKSIEISDEEEEEYTVNLDVMESDEFDEFGKSGTKEEEEVQDLDDDDCIICFHKFNPGTTYVGTCVPCGHSKFCFHCVYEHVINHFKCPWCMRLAWKVQSHLFE